MVVVLHNTCCTIAEHRRVNSPHLIPLDLEFVHAKAISAEDWVCVVENRP